MDRNDADHVCANDPAAVIALCDGALKLLALHVQGAGEWLDCAVCGDEGQRIDCTYPCDTVRLLAAMFGVSQEGTR